MRIATLWLCVLLTMCSAGVCLGEISSVSGTLSDGGSIILGGSGFGTKSPAAPILWDKFEYGNNADTLDTFDTWDAYIGDGGLITTATSYSGTRSAYNYVDGGTATRDFYTSNFFFTPTDTIFYSYKQRWLATDITGGITKFGRVNAAPSRYNGDGNFAYSSGSLTSGGGAYFFAEADSSYLYQQYHTASADNWHSVEMYSSASSPSGTDNGVNVFSVDGVEYVQDDLINRATGESWQYSNIILGLMVANVTGSGVAEMWVDDVYVDNTQARVEMCTGSTWSNRTSCDIQIPTSWSTTSITTTVNQGSFDVDDTAYLYVVDSDGTVNVNGYEVTIQAGLSNPLRTGSTLLQAGSTPLRN